jgi:hypothetical protein
MRWCTYKRLIEQAETAQFRAMRAVLKQIGDPSSLAGHA